MSYAKRLEMFDLQSLEDRCSIIDLVTYHKILSNRTRINPASLFSMNTRLSRRTNSLSLTMPLCHTSEFLHPFHVRAIKSLELFARLSCDNSAFFLFCQGCCHAPNLVLWSPFIFMFIYTHSQSSLRNVFSPCTCNFTNLFIMSSVNY